ncbi:hypothetical protein N0B31_16420 [Salinirubellus salinus]|jgi:hypothetical protein|uniref:Uncharacterized protein n=1 Tax=Salinirubellus salinus TaxID=1364945 RepID=A0A9E7R319_9EURY|nr:hypothetical protein [Salinirubellus salinus]UWM53710.1 hypothetical protein N0B31_16420 [Salinirubellus salinus]
MDGLEDSPDGVTVPRARRLGYPDSTLDLVVDGDRVELLPDRTRPIGNAAWVVTDRAHLVDLETAR